MAILAVNEITSSTWSFQVEPEAQSPELRIGFRYSGGPVEIFDNLKFGYILTVNGSVLEPVEYPRPGTRYISSDQPYIVSNSLELPADDQVTISIWSENAGIRSEGSVDFVVPRPASPYHSWVWNGEAWQSPVPYPEGDPESGLFFVWDEGSQSWVEGQTEEP